MSLRDCLWVQEGWRGRKPTVIRCTTTVPSNAARDLMDPRTVLACVMDDLALRQVWDDACALTGRVQSCGPDDLADARNLNRTQTKPALGGLVSPRDFISVGIDRALESGNTFLSVSQPCEHSDFAEGKDAIRGQVSRTNLIYQSLACISL